MKWALVVLVAAVYVVHQDFWNWNNRALVLGVLPVGLAYHAFYSCLAAAMMAILVKLAWPTALEQSVADLSETHAEGGH